MRKETVLAGRPVWKWNRHSLPAHGCTETCRVLWVTVQNKGGDGYHFPPLGNKELPALIKQAIRVPLLAGNFDGPLFSLPEQYVSCEAVSHMQACGTGKEEIICGKLKAENNTEFLLALTQEAYLPFGVLQKQICFGLLGEGLWRKRRYFRHVKLAGAWLQQQVANIASAGVTESLESQPL